MASGQAQLQQLIADLGKIPPDLRKELRPAIKKGAEPILAKMRENASWSTKIPSATRISTYLGGSNPGVRIVTNSKRVPYAQLYEGPGNFRAPLFGDREHWYAHRARPFFFRAVREKGDAVRDAVAEAIDVVVSRHGF
jgi:hypothetical protein